MKKMFKKILLVILIIMFVFLLLFLGLMLAIHTEIRLSTIINIILLAIVIYLGLYLRKAKPKVRMIIIVAASLLLLFYIATVIINISLVKNSKPPMFYLYITPTCQCGSNTTHYNCLAYGVTSTTVDYVDGTTKTHWIIFSYKDYDIGTDIFPRYVNGQISDERLEEILKERKK